MKLFLVLLALLGVTQVTVALGVLALIGTVAAVVAASSSVVGTSVAIYQAARTSSGRRSRRSGGYGGDSYSQSGYHRYRRDLTLLTPPEVEVEAEAQHEAAVTARQLDAIFAAIAMGDEDGCGLRLICELATQDRSTLGEQENMVLALFGDDVPSSGRADSPKRPYDEAAELGRRAGSSEACAATFRRCQYDAPTLIAAMKDTMHA